MKNKESNIPPWYRQFWPWFLIAIPLITIIAGIAMIFISLDKPDSIVIDDYYKEGLAINRNLQRDRLAKEFHLTAQLDIDLKQQYFAITLNGKIDNTIKEISILFSHPTHSRKDRVIKLININKLIYKGKISGIEAGRWYIQIEPDNKIWRLKGEILLKETGSYKL